MFDAHDVSEGVLFSKADTYHAVGFNGTGIKVAVIDDNFFINNTEISSNIIHSQLFNSSGTCFGNFPGDISCGEITGGSHGTAVAEIIVDMAPDVDLLVYSIGTSLDFAMAVDDATSRGADIITASLGFPTSGGDGTSVNDWYRDGTSSVAKKVNNATNNGILFTVAAGNQGSSHWSGDYVALPVANLTEPLLGDLTGNPTWESVMMFNASASGNLRACLPVNNVGSSYIVNWNAWPSTSTQDYDVFLYSSNMVDFWNGSTQTQNPTNLEPLEIFSHVSNLGNACLVIASFTSDENHRFHVDVGNNDLDSAYMIPSGSLDTPADATGALTVGAINFNNSPTNYSDDLLEAFSSQGPTDDSRIKPEICGPDRNITHQTALSGGIFPGTSASTPHVAGAAALILDENSSLTVAQLKQKLIDNARFDATFSQDNLCGSDSGSLQILTIPICQNIPTSGTWTLEESCILVTNSAMGNLIIQNSSSLTINPGITLDLSSSNSLSIMAGSSLLVKSGAELTFTGLTTQLAIIKNSINDNGGSAIPDDFNLTVEGNPVVSGVKNTFDANTPLVINESSISGYTFVSITGDPKCPGSLGGTITLEEGDNITCTITNDDVPPFLKLVKSVTNDNGGIAQPNDWILNATANVTTSSNFDNLGGSGDFTAILANNTYTLSEENGPGNYTASDWSCDTGVFTSPDKIQVPLGVNATCTITNDDVPPFLKLVKSVTNDDGGIAQPNDWILNATANVTTSSNFDNLGGSGDFTAILANNTYTLSEENGPGNYTASDWSCDTGVFTSPDKIQVPLGVNATCTITNDDVPLPSCIPPGSGNWTISSSCILNTSHVATGNVTVENNAILIVPSGVTLDIDYTSFDLIIKSGGNIIVKLGGKIT